jgi:hypothetical protein
MFLIRDQSEGGIRNVLVERWHPSGMRMQRF